MPFSLFLLPNRSNFYMYNFQMLYNFIFLIFIYFTVLLSNQNLLINSAMNTFLSEPQTQRRRQSQCVSRQKSSRKTNRLTMTQKGLNQAHRNDSKEIWKLFYNFQQETEAQTERQFQNTEQFSQKLFKKSPNKQLSQNQLLNDNNIKADQIKNLENKVKKQSFKQNQQNKKSLSKHQSNGILNKNQQKKQKSQQSFLHKMNIQIAKHLQQQRFFTRGLSNSAFSKLYKRPCMQSYGYGNVSNESQATKNLLKTHNITPHTSQNKPITYQTYTSAIKHAKRTKINEQNIQERIRRQFLKYFDDKTFLQGAQIQLAQLNKQKRSKSIENLGKKQIESLDCTRQNEQSKKKQRKKSLKEEINNKQPLFVYRRQQTDGTVRLGLDRHALTCYVDSSFSANDKVRTQFEKKVNPILPQKVRPQDLNLDLIRKQNYHRSVEQDYPGHYMVPCVITPYDRSKYQFRKKRASSVIN